LDSCRDSAADFIAKLVRDWIARNRRLMQAARKARRLPQSIALPSREPVHIASTLSYVGCAMAQLMFYIGAVLR